MATTWDQMSKTEREATGLTKKEYNQTNKLGRYAGDALQSDVFPEQDSSTIQGPQQEEPKKEKTGTGPHATEGLSSWEDLSKAERQDTGQTKKEYNRRTPDGSPSKYDIKSDVKGGATYDDLSTLNDSGTVTDEAAQKYLNKKLNQMMPVTESTDGGAGIDTETVDTTPDTSPNTPGPDVNLTREDSYVNETPAYNDNTDFIEFNRENQKYYDGKSAEVSADVWSRFGKDMDSRIQATNANIDARAQNFFDQAMVGPFGFVPMFGDIANFKPVKWETPFVPDEEIDNNLDEIADDYEDMMNEY